MNVQNNITVFSGDTRNNAQAEWANKEATESCDKKSKTIYAGDFLKEFPLRERIQQKKSEAQQRALKIVSDAWGMDKQIDDEIKVREEESKVLQEDNQEALENLKDVNQRMEELRDAFGISPDSEEQQELERIMQMRKSPTVSLEEMELTEYQKRALALDDEATFYRKQIAANNGKILENSEVNAAIRKERIKSHAMVDARKDAEEVMDASRDTAIGLVMEEAKEHLDEEQEKREEQAEAIEEKKEEQEEIQEKRDEREEELEELIKDMPVEEMTDLQQTMDEVKQQIQKVLNEVNLAAEDIKGAKVDMTV